MLSDAQITVILQIKNKHFNTAYMLRQLDDFVIIQQFEEEKIK